MPSHFTNERDYWDLVRAVTSLPVIHRTVVQVASGRIYDLARDEHPAKHDHDGGRLCDDCRVTNAWTEPRPVSR